ncbi:MAG TPA: ATP-binding protein [Chitinophagaceae bacterium]|nr:ATP-binding protein [Chitinophagaceae bacterium]
MEKIIGRENEIALLNSLVKSSSAELLAMYGRRRVGKTFLVYSYFQDQLVFELTGIKNGSLKEQLQLFSLAMQKATGSTLALKPPLNWIEAFDALARYLSTKKNNGKSVVFLDELPWLDGRKSGFLAAFEHFWNSWASRQPHLLVVVCGSAASWMIRNITQATGGLHNRITQKIALQPFTLGETAQYLKSRGCKLDNYQVLQIYMAFGGIPHYLKTVSKNNSAVQAIDKTCFSKDGLLTNEFDNLYSSLFDTADQHIKIVRTLAAKGTGMSRQQIIDASGLPSGGRISKALDELEKSGFIQQTIPFDKNSYEGIYRLVDEFSLFYLKFMDKRKPGAAKSWSAVAASQSYAAWCGIAFEAVCLKHIDKIKKALKIKGSAEASAWRYQPPKGSKQKGAQIDLIIDRADRIINLCEMKFYDGVFVIDKAYAQKLLQKQEVFIERIKPRKTVFLTLITSFGVKENDYYDEHIQQSITMDALFRP